MTEGLNFYSADRAGPALVALVVVVLAAVAEALTPGVAGTAGVLLAGPVERVFEFALQVLEEHQLVDARGKRGILLLRPLDGVVPGDALVIAGQQNQGDQTPVLERGTGINAIGKRRADRR